LPDGRIVAFARDPNDTETEPGSGVLISLAPGAAQADSLSETVVDVSDMQWTPPGDLNFLVAFQGGVMALVDPISGEGFTLPISDVVAYSWGALPPPFVAGTALPTDLYFLSADGTGVTQVWQLPADGSDGQPVTASETDVTSYAVSPDGRNLAYTDGATIWLKRLDSDTEPEELVTSADGGVRDPAFSPDGRRLAYIQGGVWIAPTAGGNAEEVLEAPPPGNELTARVYSHPRFAPNLDALLVNIELDDGGTTGVLDTNSGELLEMSHGYTHGEWLNDGRVLTFGVLDAYFKGGLHLTDVNAIDAPAILLDDSVPVLDAEETGSGRLRLLLVASTSGPSALRVVDMNISDGELTPVAEAGFMVAPSLSPDGQYAVGYRYQTGAGIRQGPLTVRSLNDGQQVVLRQPSPVWDVQWGPQR